MMPFDKPQEKRPNKIKLLFTPKPKDADGDVDMADDGAAGEGSSSSSSDSSSGCYEFSSESTGSPAPGGPECMTDDDRGVQAARLELLREAGSLQHDKKKVQFCSMTRCAQTDFERSPEYFEEPLAELLEECRTESGRAAAAGPSAPSSSSTNWASHLDEHNIHRFDVAQGRDGEVYDRALREVLAGGKETHWMWFVFPQLAGAGGVDPASCSHTARFYHVRCLAEARALLDHPRLGWRLRRMAAAVLAAAPAVGYNPKRLMGGAVDAAKLQSSMTLFGVVAEDTTVFQQVLDDMFDGMPDDSTLQLVNEELNRSG
ncbi:hypothetical protein RB594_002548 [Gaeumannomyces avenae]